jgi:hypothetical protein
MKKFKAGDIVLVIGMSETYWEKESKRFIGNNIEIIKESPYFKNAYDCLCSDFGETYMFETKDLKLLYHPQTIRKTNKKTKSINNLNNLKIDDIVGNTTNGFKFKIIKIKNGLYDLIVQNITTKEVMFVTNQNFYKKPTH